MSVRVWRPFSFRENIDPAILAGAGVRYEKALHRDTRNAGTHLVCTGGDHDSFVLLPFVAP